MKAVALVRVWRGSPDIVEADQRVLMFLHFLPSIHFHIIHSLENKTVSSDLLGQAGFQALPCLMPLKNISVLYFHRNSQFIYFF